MKGYEIYEDKWLERAENLLKEHNKNETLRYFYNTLSTKSHSTRYYYINYIVRFLDFTGKKESDLKPLDYENFLASIENRTYGYKKPVYSALKRYSKFLKKNGYNTGIDPMEDIDPPAKIESIETKQKRDRGYLTKEEVNAYVNNVKNCKSKTNREFIRRENANERDLAIILLFLNTGMRCSALYKLDVDSVNFDDNSLITVDKERKVETHYYSDEVAKALKTWIIKRNKLLEGKNENALFISNRLQRMSNDAIAHTVHKYAYAEDINNKNITPHKLRATYGTQIYNVTHDIYAVQQAMGHSDPKISEIYIRGDKDKEARINARDIMNNFISED